jgi:microsomal dipeptidase-like Zn-dependent dipeptidase
MQIRSCSLGLILIGTLIATLTWGQPAPVRAPVQVPIAKPQPVPMPTPIATPIPLKPVQIPLRPLSGWVDLHTHPMSHLAFGGKAFHGAPDAANPGVLMPARQMPYDPQCRFDTMPASRDEALSDDAPTHGDPIQSKCGDFIRNLVIVQGVEGGDGALKQPGHAVGSPAFANWPAWNDVTHQKMWFEWIRRARDGGLRVMVALAHNNRTLGDLVGPGAAITGVTDDMRSADMQIAAIKAFVAFHTDFMEIALGSADIYRIVSANKIAIVLGTEIDNIGNFNRLPPGALNPTIIQAEIQRLYGEGVRYIFPIHLTDNAFGGTAIYTADFNWANYRESMPPSMLAAIPAGAPPGLGGRFWQVQCSVAGDDVSYRYIGGPVVAGDPLGSVVGIVDAPVRAAKLGIPTAVFPPLSPGCPLGHRNALGLKPDGVTAIKTMMQLGMIVDIDHMSNNAAESALAIAEQVPGGGYPLVSGHSAVRNASVSGFNAENSRTVTQLRRIACLQGMFGLGTDGGPAGTDAYDWARQYMSAFSIMSQAPAAIPPCLNRTPLGTGSVAFGTDTNSFVKTPRPSNMAGRISPIYDPSFAPSNTAGRTWNYNADGVAHYGMYADFVRDVRTATVANAGHLDGVDLVDNHLMHSADYFWHMWQRIEAQRANVH